MSRALLEFIAKGSQHAGFKYWMAMEGIIYNLPQHVVSFREADQSTIEGVIYAYKSGVKLEPRLSISLALQSYIAVLGYLVSIVGNSDIRRYLALSECLEIVKDHLANAAYMDRNNRSDILPKAIVSYLRTVAVCDEALAMEYFMNITKYFTDFIENGLILGKTVDFDKTKVFIDKWFLLSQKFLFLPESISDLVGATKAALDISTVLLESVKKEKGII